jgi:hypothetical protein
MDLHKMIKATKENFFKKLQDLLVQYLYIVLIGI